MKPPLTPLLCMLLFCGLLPAAERIAAPLGLDAFLPVPEENPYTEAKAARGRELFFEKELSRDRSVSCATCHDPKLAFTDTRPLAVGVFGRVGNRRVPTLINRAYGKSFFWDGRVATLEEQVLKPILAEKEMDLTLEEAVGRLRAAGKYGAITAREVSHALATYVRTILSGDSAYDRYVADGRSGLTKTAIEGLRVFRGKGNCISCHVGPNLTDERFHNTGIAWRGGMLSDKGYGDGAFKTPTLRDVARRAPYMHDGSLATLEEVIEHYDHGGIFNGALDPELRPLGLSGEEKLALKDFLKSLNGRIGE